MLGIDFTEELTIPTEIELADLIVLAERQLFLEGRVKEVEDLLAETKEQLRLVQEVYIPDTMSQVGMCEFKLANGYKLTIKEDVFASIRKDFVGSAVEWLDANGLGGIVKDEIKVNFGRGDAEYGKKLMEYCVKNGYNAEEKLTVHPMTLKATVKEQLSKGIEFPEEFFSIGPVRKAVIKTK